jgi:hypothetical protein
VYICVQVGVYLVDNYVSLSTLTHNSCEASHLYFKYNKTATVSAVVCVV